MIRVSNRKCIRKVSFKQLKAAKARNLIAIFAIALTTLLFTSLFTVALSLNSSSQEYNFRQIGGYSHGSFKEVDEEKVETLSAHKKVKEYGVRTACGFIIEAPFAKLPAEISYMDENATKWSYATPTTGHMPETGMEIAMDTKALQMLGIPAKLGEQIELTYNVGNSSGDLMTRTDVFTLAGFWDFDSLMPVHYINVSKEYVESVEAEVVKAGGDSFLRSDMYVMLASSLNVRDVMEEIDTDCGYQWENIGEENCVRIGTNWGYTTSELGSNIDPIMVLAIAAFLLLIIFTGYLIIYNIFQISVSNDIRFYGLLKTIGTTPKQLKRMVRYQALYLSAVGIPIGCILGYLVGAVLTPGVLSTSIITTVKISTSPLIFAGAALFALFTVWLSCSRPGKKAARITPVEAVRYTENIREKKKKRATRGAKIQQMAFANLGRNRTKTMLVVLSLSLAVVLLNCVAMFTKSFDMEEYISSFSAADFIVGTPSYFRYEGFRNDAAMSDERIEEIENHTNASRRGTVYTSNGEAETPLGWLKEEEFRDIIGSLPEEMSQQMMDRAAKRDSLLAGNVMLEGMDESLLEKLIVYEGSLEPLKDTTQHAIALAANVNDEGELYSTPKRVGDTLTITYVEEAYFYDRRTGEPCTEDTPEEFYEYRVEKGHDVTYTVCALVGIPWGMSHRMAWANSFDAVLTSDAFIKDSNSAVQKMMYVFDTPDEIAEAQAEAFLAEYTAGDDSELMYESKALLRKEFENFRNMFLLIGTALCFVVGLVGVLNFFNAILTGILTRHREFAMLQSVGMTGKQLKQMLVYEGIFYAIGAGALSLILSLLLNPLLGRLFESTFWFCVYRFTILPVLLVIPVFVLLGVLLPLVIYKFTAKKSIVERLREAEN